VKTYTEIFVDGKAGEASIKPGHLLYRSATADVFKKHASAGQNVYGVWVALIDYLQGRGIVDDDDADRSYSLNNRMPVVLLRPGDQAYFRMKNGTNYTYGMALESAGDGTLQQHSEDTWAEAVGVDSSGNLGSGTIYTRNVVGIVLIALNLSSSSGADSYPMTLVEVI
jgi:hypothetical protein